MPLVVIDIASRYKDAEALESKNSFEIASKFEKIYSRRLDWPKTLQVDPGREFMGEVTKLMEQHKHINKTIRCWKPPRAGICGACK